MTNGLDLPVLSLTHPQALDPNLVGGKAAILSKLLQAAFPVPPGYVFTHHFFEQKTCLMNLAKESFHCLRKPLILRSSAVVEDGGSLSYAGVFESLLGITTFPQMLRGLTHCWRSGFSEKAKSYSRAHHVTLPKRLMNVIVQAMVVPRASGVAFSKHPVTSAETVVIESTWGFGDLLVSGSITPDRFEVSRATKNIVAQSIGTKHFFTTFLDNCIVRNITPPTRRHRSSLKSPDILKIANLALEIEQLLGRPQDIEWTLTTKGISIVQARPITTAIEREST